MDAISVISYTNLVTVKINSNNFKTVENYINLLDFIFNQYCSRLHSNLWKKIKEMIKLFDSITSNQNTVFHLFVQIYDSFETIFRICRIAVTKRGSQPALTSR